MVHRGACQRQQEAKTEHDNASRPRPFRPCDRLGLRSRQHALSASFEPVLADRREDDGLCVGAVEAAARAGAQIAEGTLPRIRDDAERADEPARHRPRRLPREGSRHRLFLAEARSGAGRGDPAVARAQVHLHQRQPQPRGADRAAARYPRPFRRHFRHHRRRAQSRSRRRKPTICSSPRTAWPAPMR